MKTKKNVKLLQTELTVRISLLCGTLTAKKNVTFTYKFCWADKKELTKRNYSEANAHVSKRTRFKFIQAFVPNKHTTTMYLRQQRTNIAPGPVTECKYCRISE